MSTYSLTHTLHSLTHAHSLTTSEALCPHVDDAPDAVAVVHLFKGRVDAFEGLAVGDELVDLELAGEVVIDEAGQLGAALDAAKGAALPDTASNELEGWRVG